MGGSIYTWYICLIEFIGTKLSHKLFFWTKTGATPSGNFCLETRDSRLKLCYKKRQRHNTALYFCLPKKHGLLLSVVSALNKQLLITLCTYVHAVGLCVWSRWVVYVCIVDKNRLFSAFTARKYSVKCNYAACSLSVTPSVEFATSSEVYRQSNSCFFK